MSPMRCFQWRDAFIDIIAIAKIYYMNFTHRRRISCSCERKYPSISKSLSKLAGSMAVDFCKFVWRKRERKVIATDYLAMSTHPPRCSHDISESNVKCKHTNSNSPISCTHTHTHAPSQHSHKIGRMTIRHSVCSLSSLTSLHTHTNVSNSLIPYIQPNANRNQLYQMN